MSVLFQSSVYQAFIYQLDQLIQSNDDSDGIKDCTQLYHHTIVSDKLLLLGVNISKPIDFKGEDEEFIRSMDTIKEGIDIGYTVLYDGNELPVLNGTSYNSIIKQQLITKYLSNKHYSRSPDNVIITAVTKISISDNFHGLPLQLRVIVSFPLHHQRLFPNKYRRTAQQREIDIRQLLDISKYPLPKTLSKFMSIPIRIAVPVDVKVIVRTLTLDTSLLCVSITNTHESASFKIFSFDLQLERTSYKLASELDNHSHHYLDQINIMNSLHYRDLFDIVLMNQDNDSNHEYVTLPSKETYTIAYKVSIKKPHHLESYIQSHHHALHSQKDLLSYGNLIRWSSMGKFTTPGVLYWSAFIPNGSDGTVCDFGEYKNCIVIGGKNITSNVSNDGNKDARVESSNDVGGRKDGDLKMTDNTVKGMMMLQEDKSAMDCSVGWAISSRCNIHIDQYKHNTTDFQLIVEQSSSSSSSTSHEKSKLLSSRKQQVTAGKDPLTRKPSSSSAYIQKIVEVAIQVDTLDIIINGPKNAFINEPIELTITIVNKSSTDEVKSPTIMTEREYLKRDFSEIGHSDSSFGIARSHLMHITSKLLSDIPPRGHLMTSLQVIPLQLGPITVADVFVTAFKNNKLQSYQMLHAFDMFIDKRGG